MAALASEGYVDFRGYRTWYRVVGDLGSAATPLLALHGGPGSTHHYFAPLERLAQNGRAVVLYDQVGCGRSEKRPEREWSVALFLDELDALREELVDRFGELPEPARALIECHMVRIAARPLGVARVDATHEAVQLQFIKNPPLDGGKVIEFIRKNGRHARLAGPEKLRVEAKLPAWPERAAAARDILQQLAA